MKLSNKVAIITGGVRGIGRETALLFAQEGASLAIVDVNEEGLNRISGELKEVGAKAIVSRVDISKRAEVENFVNLVVEKMGSIDILVNNAAYVYANTLLEFDEDEWDRVMAVGLKGYFLCSQAVAREMIKKGRGKIISMASIGGMIAMPTGCAYTACKAGVIGLTKSMAMELGPLGINVNAISPGPTATELLLSNITEEGKQARLNRIPLGRLGKPEEIAKAALFLASEDSDFMAGHVLTVDGGLTSVAMVIKQGVTSGQGS